MKGTWFTEKQTENMSISFRISEYLHSEETDFQNLKVMETMEFGRMLTLDDAVMTTIKDEFVYHEMLVLPALNSHPNPENVLVIGGGDGGAIREIVKNPRVKKATLCEIDGRVIEMSKKYFPEISCALDDSKVEVIVDDGIKYVQERKNCFDVIFVDSTDPVGPAVGLFSKEFYKDIFASLKEDGIFAAQTESPWINPEFIKNINENVKEIFPIKAYYIANVPTYPTGMWSFTIGSKKYDPLKVDPNLIQDSQTKYYNKEIHFNAFKLPNFVKKILD